MKPALLFTPAFLSEFTEWFSLAWPLCATLLCRTGMMLTDVSVLGLWDSEYLGAAGVASLYTSLTSVVVWRGLLEALNTLCGQAYGAKNYKLVGRWLAIGTQTALLVSIGVAATWLYAGTWLQPLAGFDDEERDRVDLFCRISIAGLIPFSVYVGVSNFLGTLMIVKPLLVINFASLIVNLVLNWFLVTGALGFAGFGFKGSPMATTLTRILVFLITWVWITRTVRKNPESDLAKCWPKSIKDFIIPPWYVALHQAETEDVTGYRPLSEQSGDFMQVDTTAIVKPARKSLIAEFCSVAIPIAFSSLLEEAQIQVVGLMAARLGDEEIATHNAIMQVFFVMSSFLWATASATQVRMSTHLGAGDAEKAKISMRVGAFVGVVCGVFVALAFIIGGEHIAALYSKDAPEVRRLTGEIAYLVGLGYLGLTAFYVSMAALNAQARVGFVVVAFIVGAWGVAVPMAYLFAFRVGPTKGLFGLWLGLLMGYLVITVIVVYGVMISDWDQIAKEAVERSVRGRAESEPAAFQGNDEDDDEGLQR